MTDLVSPMVVIGGGRIGTALHALSQQRQWPCRLVSRTDGWSAVDAPGSGPLVVCVRNDDLAAVIARVPAARRPDLVFTQNGMLRPWLAAADLAECTRALVFFAVGVKGQLPQPGGVSPVCGPHAAAVANWWSALGLPAAATSAREFAEVELEKLLWNTILGVVCQARGCDVGTAAQAHRAQIAELVAELAPLAAPALGIAAADVDCPGLTNRLCAYSASIASYRAAVKEWPWRNGWFVDRARALAIRTPAHDGALRLGQVGEFAG